MPKTRQEFRERRKQTVSAAIPRQRFRRGEFQVEIILDRRAPRIVHCVIQRHGSAEILLLEQFYSRAEAEAAARQFIVSYGAHRRGSGNSAA